MFLFLFSSAEHLDTLLRSLVLNRLVKFGDKEFANEARKKFEEHCAGVKSIPADLRSVVYKAVISVDGKAAFDSLLKVKISLNYVLGGVGGGNLDQFEKVHNFWFGVLRCFRSCTKAPICKRRRIEYYERSPPSRIPV